MEYRKTFIILLNILILMHISDLMYNYQIQSYLYLDLCGLNMYVKVSQSMWAPQGILAVNMLHPSPVPQCMSQQDQS